MRLSKKKIGIAQQAQDFSSKADAILKKAEQALAEIVLSKEIPELRVSQYLRQEILFTLRSNQELSEDEISRIVVLRAILDSQQDHDSAFKKKVPEQYESFRKELMILLNSGQWLGRGWNIEWFKALPEKSQAMLVPGFRQEMEKLMLQARSLLAGARKST